MRIAVIGGGAAGFFSAIAAAESGISEVMVFEASSKCLEKVRVSGGGRCNVTHACFDTAELCSHYPRGGKELRQAFSRFMTGDTVNWFEEHGVELKTERDGRMFPVTDDSSTIVNCLLKTAESLGVNVRLRSKVSGLKKKSDGFVLVLLDGKELEFDKVIVTTGGHPKKESYEWLALLGHSVISPVPSLFTFNIPYEPLRELMGVSVDHARVDIVGMDEHADGPLLITHWGLSGPAVLRCSSFAARKLADAGYVFQVSVDWLPDESVDETVAWMESQRKEKRAARFRNTPHPDVPRRLWEFLLREASIAVDSNWSDLKKEAIRTFSLMVHDHRFRAEGKTTFKEEFVTCGGISLREIDFKTMESRVIRGLYFAGEVLDIDAVTGGFNFQAAWTTGFIAGHSASEN